MEHGKVERLRQKIISDAEAEARKIIAEGEAEAETVRNRAQAEVDKVTAEFRARAEAEAREHIRRRVSLRDLEARNALLAEKGKVIDEVFAKALEELRRRDRDGGYSITRDLLLKAIQTGDEEIIVSPEDRKAIGGAFLAALNAEIKKSGQRGEITLSPETRQIKGGFILRRGRAETNSSFETLLSMVRDDVETEVAGILFKESGKTA